MGKKTNTIVFNNPVLNDTIPKIFAKIQKIEDENQAIKKELFFFDPIVENVVHYMRAFDNLKDISFEKNTNDEKIANNKILRTFLKEYNRVQSDLLAFRDTTTHGFEYTNAFIEEKKKLYDVLLEKFYNS